VNRQAEVDQRAVSLAAAWDNFEWLIGEVGRLNIENRLLRGEGTDRDELVQLQASNERLRDRLRATTFQLVNLAEDYERLRRYLRHEQDLILKTALDLAADAREKANRLEIENRQLQAQISVKRPRGRPKGSGKPEPPNNATPGLWASALEQYERNLAERQAKQDQPTESLESRERPAD
jgi:hypothetical protein